MSAVEKRIEKLLNLAKNNPNSAEAQAAINKAQQLLNKKKKKATVIPLLEGRKEKSKSGFSFHIPKFQLLKFKRQATVTYCITPNNSPEPKTNSSSSMRSHQQPNAKEEQNMMSDYILNTLSSIHNDMNLADRIRFKDGIQIRLNDIIKYTIAVEDRTLKFYLTVPKGMAKPFVNAIKMDWGQVDITKVDNNFMKLKQDKCRAMEVGLKFHYGLSTMVDKNQDPFYQNIGAIASQMVDNEKLMVVNMIKPVAEEDWKREAKKGYSDFKKGVLPSKKEWSVDGLIDRVLNVVDKVFNEFLDMVDALMGSETSPVKAEQPWDDKYSREKSYEGVKGFQNEIYVVVQSDDHRRPKHLLKAVQNAFETISGDNRFVFRHKTTKKGIKVVIERIENSEPKLVYKGGDIYSSKELGQFMHIPNRKVLKDFKDVIDQDSYTRVEINPDFLKPSIGATAFARTLDKVSQTIYLGDYDREWWTPKGRKAKDKQKLDDRSQAWMLFGMQGSGKTSLIIRKIVQTFGVHYSKEEWKEKSKSVVAFDVADGEIIAKVWNLIPEWLRHRVIILNHAVPERPVPVNFADLEEFNRKVMNDPDYAYNLAEMESGLIKEIIESGQSIYVDRWFPIALQCAHLANPDYGIPEAIKLLIDDEFRLTQIVPHIKNERLLLELQIYNKMSIDRKTDDIVKAIQNRLTQLERDPKLWDVIAQRPLRDEDGNCMMNMRKWIDGDEDGAYLVLVYVPKEGVTKTFRKFVFAHYMTKIWSAVVSREKGFAGREYRPECLIVVDEIHQILDVQMIGRMFIDLFKEPRKYSARFVFSLHGWSSIAKAGRSIESDIKQSILDNGCNFVMLKGGRDAFQSLDNFFQGMTVDDYDNLMNMKYCGIFSIRWGNQNHVFQAQLLPPVETELKTYAKWDLYDLASYRSPFSRDRDEVRRENLERIKSMLEGAATQMQDSPSEGGADECDMNALRRGGTRERKSQK